MLEAIQYRLDELRYDSTVRWTSLAFLVFIILVVVVACMFTVATAIWVAIVTGCLALMALGIF